MNVTVVTSFEQLEEIITRNGSIPSVCIPIWDDGRVTSYMPHDDIIAYFLSYAPYTEMYILGNGHPDIPIISIYPLYWPKGPLLLDNVRATSYCYTPEPGIQDTHTQQFVTKGSIKTLQDFYTPYHRIMHQQLPQYAKIGNVIPITKWIETVSNYMEYLLSLGTQETPATIFYDTIVLPTIHWLEASGMKVNPTILKQHYPNAKLCGDCDDIVMTKYNIFTTTGRPSNSFGGINFLALNKTTGSREAFISRFEGGRLMQFDFDAHHLRLLAKEMHVPITTQSVHQMLAEQYFKTTNITKEMYEQGKQTTFAILYGAEPVTDTPPLLEQIKKLEHSLWVTYQTDQCFYAPISKRKIIVPEPSPSKVLNYFVQCLEFETAIQKLDKLRESFSGFISKPILYTYDALLIDCAPEEARAVKNICEQVLQEGGFPVKLSVGTNYHNLQELANK